MAIRRSRHRAPAPTDATRDTVIARDSINGTPTCQWCGRALVPGRFYSLQHRRPRGMGGTSDPTANLPANLVLVHGSGTTECHGQMESQVGAAFLRGFRVPQGVDPATVPLDTATRGLILLDNLGGFQRIV